MIDGSWASPGIDFHCSEPESVGAGRSVHTFCVGREGLPNDTFVLHWSMAWDLKEPSLRIHAVAGEPISR